MPLKTAGRRHHKPPLRGGEQHAAACKTQSTCGAAATRRNMVSSLFGSIDLATSGTDFRLVPLSRPATYGDSRSTERPSHTSRHQAARGVTDMEHGIGRPQCRSAQRESSMGCRVGIHNCHHQLLADFLCQKTVIRGVKCSKFSSRGYRPAPLFGRTPPSAVTRRRPPGKVVRP